MQDKTISKEREAVFELFIRHRKLGFNEIEKSLAIRSNHLAYHLNKLLEEKILEKEDGCYKLTKSAEKLIPSFVHITGKEEAPVTIVVSAILNKDKICLLKRRKRPYQGYWGMPAGKLRLHESIRECALRESKEETSLDCRFKKTAAILHERVKDDNDIKHAFIIFLCKLQTSQAQLKESEEGELGWFNLKKLPKNTIPSDKAMIYSLLKGKLSCKDVLIEDKEGNLSNMVMKNGGRL